MGKTDPVRKQRLKQGGRTSQSEGLGKCRWGPALHSYRRIQNGRYVMHSEKMSDAVYLITITLDATPPPQKGLRRELSKLCFLKIQIQNLGAVAPKV